MIRTEDILNEREQTHGDFNRTAWYAQQTKQLWNSKDDWLRLTPIQREALDHMATKVARILSGDPNEAEHWRDIGGYAKLAEREIEENVRPDIAKCS